MSNLIKQDNNLLEYPLYALQERSLKEDIAVSWEGNEFKVTVGYKTPNATDMLYLYYFIKILQNNGYESSIIEVPKNHVVKALSEDGASYYYKRLRESLKVWCNVGISFEGIFYDGENYETKLFGILDNAYIKKDGLVQVEFNKNFIDIMKNTNFYRYINFDELKRLRKPLARRLYELLKKNSSKFSCEALRLAQKLNLKRKYPSDIKAYIIPALNEINKNTSLKIDFSCKTNQFGKSICYFKHAEIDKKITHDVEKKDEDGTLFNEQEIKVCKEVVEGLCISSEKVFSLISKYGINKIKTVFAHVKADESLKNPAGFFIKALEEDYKIISPEDRELSENIKSLKLEAQKCFQRNPGGCRAEFLESKLHKYDKACYWCKKFEKHREEDLKDKPEINEEERIEFEKKNLEAQKIKEKDFMIKILEDLNKPKKRSGLFKPGSYYDPDEEYKNLLEERLKEEAYKKNIDLKTLIDQKLAEGL